MSVTQDNNEAASAPDLQSRIYAELVKAFKDDPANACRAHAAITEALAASASQSGTAGAPDLLRACRKAVTALAHAADNPLYKDAYEELSAAIAEATSAPVPRVGGPDEAKPESPDLAHVARQRQESAAGVVEFHEPSWQKGYACGYNDGLGDGRAEQSRRVTPSAAVAEGVDTPELEVLIDAYAKFYGLGTNEELAESYAAIIAHIDATYGAQQREAGRREAFDQVQADEAKLYRDLTGDVTKLGYQGLAHAVAALARAKGVSDEQRDAARYRELRKLSVRDTGFALHLTSLTAGRTLDHFADECMQELEAALARQPSGTVPSDEQIEQAALKHVATGWKQLAAVSDRDPDYRKTEHFVRLKAFALDLCATPAHGQEEDVLAIEALLAQYHEEVWNTAQSENPDYDYAGRETAKKLTRAIRALARQPVSEGLTEYGRNIIKNAAKALRCASFNASAEDLEAILSAVPPAKAEGMSDTERNAERWKVVESAGSETTLRLHNARPDERTAVVDAILAQQAKKGGAA